MAKNPVTKDKSPQNLQKFLKSKDKALITMGLSMSKSIDVSDSIACIIGSLYMLHEENDIRKKAKTVFVKKAPENLKKVVKDNWKTRYRTEELPPTRKLIEELKKNKYNGLASIIQRDIDKKLKKFISGEKRNAHYYRTHYSIIGKDYQKILDASPKNPYYEKLDMNSIEILGNSIISNSSNRPWYKYGIKGFIGDLANLEVVDKLISLIKKEEVEIYYACEIIMALSNRFEALEIGWNSWKEDEFNEVPKLEINISKSIYNEKIGEFQECLNKLYKLNDSNTLKTCIGIAFSLIQFYSKKLKKEYVKIIENVAKQDYWEFPSGVIVKKVGKQVPYIDGNEYFENTSRVGNFSGYSIRGLRCNCVHPQGNFQTYQCKHILDIGWLFSCTQKKSSLAKNLSLEPKYDYPVAAIAPSGRAKCLHNGEKIPKGELRIEVKRKIETAAKSFYGTGYILPSNLKKYVAKGGFDGDDTNGELFTDDWEQVVKVLKKNSSHLSEEKFKELEGMLINK